MKVLLIKADTNDADYVISENIIKDDELEKILHIIDVVKTKTASMTGWSRHNWPWGEYSDNTPSELYEGLLTEDEIEMFQEYLPYGEFGIHTIISIKLLHVEREEDLLDTYKIEKRGE
jgi:hypothetical protein